MTEHPNPTGHAYDCDWHLDQYWFECTCEVYRQRIADERVMFEVDAVARSEAAAKAAHERTKARYPKTMARLADHERAESERKAVVAWLRRQDILFSVKARAEPEGTTGRAVFGGAALALCRAANAIERGEHIEGDA